VRIFFNDNYDYCNDIKVIKNTKDNGNH